MTTAAFVWVFFGTGRKWLALLGPGFSCVALIADLMPQPKLVYLHLTGIKKIPTFGGATYTVADGVENPLNALFYLGVFLLLVFVADASVTLWRRGAHRRAAVVGGAITFFVLLPAVRKRHWWITESCGRRISSVLPIWPSSWPWDWS